MALNTIQYQDELTDMRGVVKAAKDAGIDAVICWDYAVLDACRDIGMEIHLSTQASVSNASAIKHYHDAYGVRRFVLARECTLDHVKRIRQDLGALTDDIELEAFAHGAMCVSVSGRCFLTEHTGRFDPMHYLAYKAYMFACLDILS